MTVVTPDRRANATVADMAEVTWSVDVAVDAGWYALKGALADQPCPPESSTHITIDGQTALVGRTSPGRDILPQVPLDADTGVSRRHAQLVVDGDRLTVVDLSSTNGTYVVAPDEEPADATPSLVAGVPRELHDGDTVYVGAWSRLTVRRSPAGH